MKTKSILVSIISLFVLLASFQNCGKKNNDFIADENANDFESDQAKLVTVIVGDDLTMQVPALDLQEMFGALPFTCKWAFKNSEGVIVELDGVKIEKLDIDAIEKVEAGRYRVLCSVANKTLKGIFIVVVNDKPTPVVDKGLLKVHITTETTSKHYEFSDLTKSDALAKCQKYGTDNATSNVKCLWKDLVIFDQVIPVVKKATYTFTTEHLGTKTGKGVSDLTEDAAKKMCDEDVKVLIDKLPNAGYDCTWDAKSFKKKAEVIVKGVVKIYLIKEAKESLLLTQKDITKVDAVTLCKQKASENKAVGLKCVWNEAVVYSVPEPVIKSMYRGYFIENGKSRLFIETPLISRADALANCLLNAKNNPNYGIKCTWAEEYIYKKAEPVVMLGILKGYFIENGKERLFIHRDKISKIEALAVCKHHAEKSENLGVKCTFNGDALFLKPEPLVTKMYRGYFIENGKERLFISTASITRANALANCLLNAKNNPKYGVKCTWGEEVIHKAAEPVLKNTYKGYFIDKNVQRLFITTHNISRADALTNCKLNSSNNPKLGIKCTWGQEVILQKAQP